MLGDSLFCWNHTDYGGKCKMREHWKRRNMGQPVAARDMKRRFFTAYWKDLADSIRKRTVP